MIKSLFFSVFSFKRHLPESVFGFLLGIFSVIAYLDTPLEKIRYVQSELPELFTLFGYYGATGLPVFVLSLLYGFFMPLFISVLCASSAYRVVMLPVHDGRMAFYSASRYSRQSLMFTYSLAALMPAVLFNLSVLLAQIIASLIFFLQADLLALLRLNLGFLIVSLLLSSLCVMLANFSKTERGMRVKTRIILGLMLLFLVLSRLKGAGNLKYLTFWSLFEGMPLLFGSGGFLSALLAALLGALMLLMSILSFSKREL
ncbi:MAG: hypothetical protein QM308_09745 [Bacillota bacterium]|nr:hypothetical protein [Bacillota bacterium]